jgi:hypothetical protein
MLLKQFFRKAFTYNNIKSRQEKHTSKHDTMQKIFLNILAFLLITSTQIFVGCISAKVSTKDGETIQQISDSLVPAFPGAMGGGMYTTGGRGGKVIKVTNLNDNGPGSLRAALRVSEPRIVVFDVSGTIELTQQLVINNGNVTIAGQTAPGDGICLKNYGLRVNADNVIIRYMRFRPGDVANAELDAFTAIGQKDIIVDHCSMSWSTDETVSIYDNENITLQWCIISESLNESVHSKGAHGYGGIWGGKNSSFLNNILAHHVSRNPRLQGTRYQDDTNMEKAELINNLIYNWGNKSIYGGENGKYNIINNLFIPGPATRASQRGEALEPYVPVGKFYLHGNILIDGKDTLMVESQHVTRKETMDNILMNTPFQLPVKTSATDVLEAYRFLLAHAGASMKRDEVDKRIINDITSRSFTYGKSGIIDSQNETGGWPELATAPPLPDSDNDGIPDEWEIKHNLNHLTDTDASEIGLHPLYTNIEVYINSLVHTYTHP